MYVIPKKIDPALRERAVRLVREHRSECPSLTAASAAVARQVGVGNGPCAGGYCKQISTTGPARGVTSAEYAEIKRLKTENSRLREDVAILKGGDDFLRGEPGPRNR